MAKEAPYASPYRARKREQIDAVIASYYRMKKDPRNTTAEWKRQIAAEYGVSEYTIMYYLRNRPKTK
ncbi:MAG: hypothetical protein WCR72_01905 [Bacteroidota bacterium]